MVWEVVSCGVNASHTKKEDDMQIYINTFDSSEVAQGDAGCTVGLSIGQSVAQCCYRDTFNMLRVRAGYAGTHCFEMDGTFPQFIEELDLYNAAQEYADRVNSDEAQEKTDLEEHVHKGMFL